MGFLDNSGDIILDAVLTDTGRFRIARGGFKINKFALGDDEINYQLFRNSNHPDGAHPSGSAYYDLQIMQTPVLEAFTNNSSLMHSKLVSYQSNDLFYLPVIRLNTVKQPNIPNSAVMKSQGFVVGVDSSTQDSISTNFASLEGVLKGATPDGTKFFRVDQGLETTELPASTALNMDLREDQYQIQIDNRLAQVISPEGSFLATPSFIDDDSIANYFFSVGVDTSYVTIANPKATDSGVTNDFAISGPRGTILKFSLKASINLNTSTYLFDLIGNSSNLTVSAGTYRVIDSFVRIIGISTGYRIDIPVKFLKSTS